MTEIDFVGLVVLGAYLTICGAQIVGYLRYRRQQRILFEKYRNLFDPEDR